MLAANRGRNTRHHRVNEADEREKRVSVKVNVPGARVRTRTTATESSPREEARDALVSNLFRESARDDLGIKVLAGRPTRKGKDWDVPFEIRIPLRSLLYLPEGKKSVARAAVYIVSGEKPGSLTDVTEVHHMLDEPPPDLQGPYFTHAFIVRVRGTGSVISVGVIDEASGGMSYKRIEVRPAG